MVCGFPSCLYFVVEGKRVKGVTSLGGKKLLLARMGNSQISLLRTEERKCVHGLRGLGVLCNKFGRALCLSMIGAYNNKVLQTGVCAIGEVGLGGELRTVP